MKTILTILNDEIKSSSKISDESKSYTRERKNNTNHKAMSKVNIHNVFTITNTMIPSENQDDERR